MDVNLKSEYTHCPVCELAGIKDYTLTREQHFYSGGCGAPPPGTWKQFYSPGGTELHWHNDSPCTDIFVCSNRHYFSVIYYDICTQCDYNASKQFKVSVLDYNLSIKAIYEKYNEKLKEKKPKWVIPLLKKVLKFVINFLMIKPKFFNEK